MLPATFFVALTGTDAAGFGTAAGTPCRSIQFALGLAAAAAGTHTIDVAGGTYSNAAFDNLISINSPNLANLQLLGGWNAAFTSQTPGTTIYIPQQAGVVGSPDVDVNNVNVKIDGFYFVFDGTLGAGGSRPSGGIFSRTTGLTVSRNTFESGSGPAGRSYALQTTGTEQTGLMITNNAFIASGSLRASGCIYLNPDPVRTMPVVISNNSFTGANLTTAIIVDTTGLVNITNNTITRTTASGFPLVLLRPRNVGGSLTSVNIQQNTIDGAGVSFQGIQVNDIGVVNEQVTNLNISNNILANSVQGLAISAGTTVSNVNVFENSITGNTAPIVNSATAGVVDASGNWWGVAIGADPNGVGRANINALAFAGAIQIGSFLNSGTNTSATGFTAPGNTEMWVPNRTPALTFVNGVIQSGINTAVAGMTVRVAADTYAENVTITKAITLLGNQAGQNANTRFAAFTTGVNGPKADPTVETVLTAPTVNPSGGNPGANDLIRVVANNITINGLVIDGNNPSLAASPVQVGTINIDARRGIQNSDAKNNFFDINNLLIENNIIQNIAQRGIELSNNATVSTGNLITGNVISNFGSGTANGGLGIILFTNAYADITNNTIIDLLGETGVQLQNFYRNGAMTWSGNDFTVGQDGIAIVANLFYAPSAVLNITNNTVNAAAGVTGASGFTMAVYVSSVQVGSTVNISGNTLGSTGGQFARGISLWNLPTTATVTVTGGTIANTLVGIDLDNVDLFFGSGATTTVDINNVAITAATVGVRVSSDPIAPPPQSGSNVPGGSVQANISGGSITGAATGVLVQDSTADGFTATVNLMGGNTITGTGGSTGVSIVGAQATASIKSSVISNNSTGINVGSSTGNLISMNSIFANGPGGEIKLGPGANNNQVYPILTGVSTASATMIVTGSLASTVNGAGYRLEFFASTGLDASGMSQGMQFIGFLNVTGNGGTVAFSANLAASTPGTLITATATHVATSDTSPFSNALMLPPPPVPPTPPPTPPTPPTPLPPTSTPPPPFVSVTFTAPITDVLTSNGLLVTEVVSSSGVLTQFDPTGVHQLATGVRSASVAFGAGGEVLLVVFQNGQLFEFDAAGTHLLAVGVLSANVTFLPGGTQEVLEVVFVNGTLVQYDAAGGHQLATGVQTASVAFSARGEVIDVVYQNGQLVQFDGAGAHQLAANAIAASIALSPVGAEVLDVIFADQSLWQFDATGGHKLGMV
jgi:hypothetical protein